MKKTILIFTFLTSTLISYSQNVYKEQLSNCNTERFALESQKKIAKIDDNKLINLISKITTDKNRNTIKGVLKLQFIVYKNGKSCFFSYENETNIKTSELNIEEFKNIVDSNLIWENGIKNVTALLEIKFKKKKIQLTRFGMDGISGWHKLTS